MLQFRLMLMFAVSVALTASAIKTRKCKGSFAASNMNVSLCNGKLMLQHKLTLARTFQKSKEINATLVSFYDNVL